MCCTIPIVGSVIWVEATNPSPVLKSLWRELHRVLPLYQFGRHELIPIRKNGAALCRYVGGYIRKSMEFRPLAAKGARLITYSKNFPRKVVGHAWAFNSPGGRFWRQKLQVFAGLHGVKEYSGLKEKFGPRWAWWFRDVIESLNLLHLPLTSDERNAFMQGLPEDRLNDSLASGVSLRALHLYCPRLPLLEGKEINPPKDLVSYFAFHFAHWRKKRAELHSDFAYERFSAFLLPRVGPSPRLDAAKAAILAPRPVSAAVKRVRTYQRTAHSSYFPEYYET